MKIIGIILIVIGSIGTLLSLMMFGDIGVAAFIGSITAILAGIGFIMVNRKINKLS